MGSEESRWKKFLIYIVKIALVFAKRKERIKLTLAFKNKSHDKIECSLCESSE